jgi:hypothetical protein
VPVIITGAAHRCGAAMRAKGRTRQEERVRSLACRDSNHVVGAQGRVVLAEERREIDRWLRSSFPIRLGGQQGQQRGWGQCLAVRADNASHLRSELGHDLAKKSRGAGLRGIGAVVYREVRPSNLPRPTCCVERR